MLNFFIKLEIFILTISCWTNVGLFFKFSPCFTRFSLKRMLILQLLFKYAITRVAYFFCHFFTKQGNTVPKRYSITFFIFLVLFPPCINSCCKSTFSFFIPQFLRFLYLRYSVNKDFVGK